MPLYAGHDGAQAKINKLYAGIDGISKEIDFLYAGVNGAAKEVFVGVYRWEKYNVSYYLTPKQKTGLSGMYKGYAMFQSYYDGEYAYSRPSNYKFTLNSNSPGFHDFTKQYSARDEIMSYLDAKPTNRINWYFPIYDNTADQRYYIGSSRVGHTTTKLVFKWDGGNGQYGWTGVVYDLVQTPERGDALLGTVESKDINAYPIDGEQDGFWYVMQEIV